MNGTDFIKALDDGKVLVSKGHIMVYLNKWYKRYTLRTKDWSIYTSGDELEIDEKSDAVILKDDRKGAIMVIESDTFEVSE